MTLKLVGYIISIVEGGKQPILTRRKDKGGGNMNNLSKEIKVARTRLNLTQSDVALKLDMSSGTYIKYENNPETMPLKILFSLIDILDVSSNNIRDHVISMLENGAE